MDTHGNPLTDEERRGLFQASVLRLAVERGFKGVTFATADELRVPGYGAAYRRGQRARELGRQEAPL